MWSAILACATLRTVGMPPSLASPRIQPPQTEISSSHKDFYLFITTHTHTYIHSYTHTHTCLSPPTSSSALRVSLRINALDKTCLDDWPHWQAETATRSSEPEENCWSTWSAGAGARGVWRPESLPVAGLLEGNNPPCSKETCRRQPQGRAVTPVFTKSFKRPVQHHSKACLPPSFDPLHPWWFCGEGPHLQKHQHWEPTTLASVWYASCTEAEMKQWKQHRS